MKEPLVKRWIKKNDPDPETVNNLQTAININRYIAILMAQRGLRDFDEAKKYFNPTAESLYDPFLMKGMATAIERIEHAIQKNEKILIYGDYDVDGTTSVALLYNYFRQFYSSLDYYVPDRFKEGYGISMKGIDYATEKGISLIIALDCGIKDIPEAAYAKQNKIDLIICDHHTPGNQLPEAIAILNPKQNDCSYPYDELSGCGIGYKLLQAYHQKTGSEFDPIDFIDLVAVSIASDIVPMVDENRILCYLGLQKINNKPVLPFKILLANLELKKELSVSDLVFIIGPRINAAGRMMHAKHAVEFLISQNETEAFKHVNKINKYNTDRKEIDSNMAEDALKLIESSEALQKQKTTVLWDARWHKGVIGIVASRLIESYYRPTILLTESEGKLVGSARSVAGFNLYRAIESCSEHLEQFGGHQYAAGLTLKKENFEAFAQKFEEVVAKSIKPEMLVPAIEYDLEIPLENVNLNFQHTINRFGPFGPENMTPRFITKNTHLAYKPRVVGENHLKLSFASKNGNIDGIAFGMGYYQETIDFSKAIDICYTIDENIWNGNRNVQLMIKDIRPADIKNE